MLMGTQFGSEQGDDKQACFATPRVASHRTSPGDCLVNPSRKRHHTPSLWTGNVLFLMMAVEIYLRSAVAAIQAVTSLLWQMQYDPESLISLMEQDVHLGAVSNLHQL
jgi:hypothetical protein